MNHLLTLRGFSFLLAALGLIVASLLIGTGEASAHANQIRSNPSPNAELETSPDRIIVWFSEPIEPTFSRMNVLDSAGDEVDNGDSRVDPGEPTAMVVTVPDLSDGTYTVSWRNLSTVDGHTVRGSFLFAVGEPLAAGGGVEVADQPLLQSPFDPWMRWVFFLGAVAFMGGLFFELFISGPVLGLFDTGTAGGRVAQRLSGRLTLLATAGVIAMAAGLVGQLVQQAAVNFETSVFQVFGEPIRSVLLDSDWGQLWLWRAALVLGAGVVLALASRARQPSDDDEEPGLLTESMFGPVALLIGLGILLLTTLSSHSAAVPDDVWWMAVANDYAHLVAAAVWVGGLIYLAAALPVVLKESGTDRQQILATITPRFSVVAFLSSGVLVITGVFSGWLQVTVPAATATPYGWTLVAKIALLAPLFSLGAVNSFWVRRQLGINPSAGFTMRRLVTAEVAVAALVLLAVGWMTSLEPARQYASRHGIGVDTGFQFSDTTEGATINVDMTPAQVGMNDVLINIEDRRGEPITNAEDVRIRVTFVEQDLGGEFESAAPHGPGEWIIHDVPMTIAGVWQGEVVVTRPDAFDARTGFRMEVTSAGATSAISPSQDVTLVLFGVELALLGALFIVGVPITRVASRPRISVAAPAAVVIAVGLALVLNVQVLRVGLAEDRFNPFPPTPDSLEQGGAVYATHCASCHGMGGRGDGPAGAELDPPPADLVVHVPLHPDGELFTIIQEGVPGTAMPAFEGTLSDDEIWHLINYLRTLEE
ncbi:MAG: copper resistance protein CopC [Dehalococcoidia bacterium]